MRAGDEVRTIQLAAGSAWSSCLGWIAGDEGVNVLGGFGGGLGTSLEAAPPQHSQGPAASPGWL